jgi:hypothetical protein
MRFQRLRGVRHATAAAPAETRRSWVLRLRLAHADVTLGVGVLVAMLGVVMGGAPVQAQTLSYADPALSSPGGDWKPGSPPRFEKKATTYGNAPGFGAGITGFDSTNNARRKAATKAKAKPGAGRPLAPLKTGRVMPITTSPPPLTPPLQLPSAYTPSVTGSIKPKRKPTPEADPFDAVGIKAGSFLLRPAVELTGGYDTNPNRAQNGAGSAFFIVAPELVVRSDWARHDLRADLRGSYTTFTAQPTLNRPYFESKIDGRIDATSQTRIDLQNRFLLSTDNPGSANLQAGLAKLPIYTKLGGTVGVAHRFNRAELGGKLSVDRTAYRDSTFTDGSTGSNADRDFFTYGLQLRGTYEVTPGIIPFVQLDADNRVHDLAVDRSGVQRDSKGFSPRIGSSFEISRILTGSASLGYATRSYADPRLEQLHGLIADASLVWLASPLTTATFTAASTVNETTLPDVSAILSRDFGLQVDHSFRRWLIGSFKLGYGIDDFVGSNRIDQRLLASAALTYKFTRTTQVKGEVRQELRRSNATGQDYTASIFLVGLRLQR